jgi:hypothetical protein
MKEIHLLSLVVRQSIDNAHFSPTAAPSRLRQRS